MNNEIHFAISQPGHCRINKTIRKTYDRNVLFQISVSLRIWWLQISAIWPSGINNISSCFLCVPCHLKLKIPRYYFSDWSLPFAPIIERHSSANCHALQNKTSHVDPRASGAFLGLFFWLNRNRTPLPSSGLLRIWNANPHATRTIAISPDYTANDTAQAPGLRAWSPSIIDVYLRFTFLPCDTHKHSTA